MEPPDRLRKMRMEGRVLGTELHAKSANSSTKSSTHKIHRTRPESGGGIGGGIVNLVVEELVEEFMYL